MIEAQSPSLKLYLDANVCISTYIATFIFITVWLVASVTQPVAEANYFQGGPYVVESAYFHALVGIDMVDTLVLMTCKSPSAISLTFSHLHLLAPAAKLCTHVYTLSTWLIITCVHYASSHL